MTRGTTKSNGQKHIADKFYTKPAVALSCIYALNIEDYDRVIEPSAGSGSFSKQVDCTAYDLFPEDDSIVQMDWFNYTQSRGDAKTLVLGNPPFGQQNTLAIAFINHAAKFADTIAFILPLSFRKESIINKLDKHLILRDDILLDKKAFTLDGKDYEVPCAFFIWDYDETVERAPFPKHEPKGFRFVKKTDSPTISVQRVGGRAGKGSAEWHIKNVQTNYFIELDNPDMKDQVVELLEGINIAGRDNSVGPRSLSRNEVTSVVNQVLYDLTL